MKKETALISGASSGIGYELARIMGASGHDLVLVARSTSRLMEIKKELETKFKILVHVIGKDLSLEHAPAEIAAELSAQNMTIDILVNNAGFGGFGEFWESDWKKEKEMIDLNIRSLTEMTKLFLPGMVKRKNGKVMNLGSTASFQPGPLMAVYYASKAYVLSFSEAIAEELRGTGVTVTCLCPGPTTSGFQAAASIEDSKLVKGKKLPSSKQVAEYGYKAMMKGKVVAIEGFMNRGLAGSVRFSPRWMVRRTVKKMQEKKK
jgi:short-subunit dehydrogenase